MKDKLLWMIVISLSVSFRSLAQSGYHYRGEFISLSPDTSAMCFVQPRASLIGKISVEEILSKRLGSSTGQIQKVSDNRYFVTRQRIEDERLYISDIYTDDKGNRCVILPRIAFEIVDGTKITDILEHHSCLFVIRHDGNVYRLSCDVRTSREILEIIAKIESEKSICWCEPIKRSGFITNNPLYSDQYYLKNTGQNGGTTGMDINIENAWGITSGSPNVTVAVIDQGIDSIHEDMSECILSGYTIRNATGYGTPQNVNDNDCKGHGVACAGIIGANDNSIGIKGIASGVKLLPVNIVPDYILKDQNGYTIDSGFGDDDEIADAITWAYQRADVLSCSWGCSESELISQAIYNARILGRNGKGCIVVCASGNSYSELSVRFPAKVNGVLTVGAVDNTGTIWNYSCRGNSMDLVAPSGYINMNGDIATTDRMGNLGYNTNLTTEDLLSKNYTKKFGGTSAACPQVAGVAALMLSLRPDLTEEQVRTTLQNTARNLGPAGFDTTYGYGLVDAYAAVSAVDFGSNIVGKTVLCDTATYSVTDIPAGYTISWSVDNNNFSITTNSNQCLVTYTGTPQYETANLTATLMWNGYAVKSISKRIVMHGTDMYLEGIQSGIYDENGDMPAEAATFTIPATLASRGGMNRLSTLNRDSIEMSRIPVVFESMRTITIPDNPTYGVTEIYGGADIYLDGERLDGMTISFSGDRAPEYLSTDGGTMISFRMPEVSSITDVLGYYYVVLHATSEGGCHDFDLYFKVIPVEGESIGDPEISLYFTDSSVRVDFYAMEWEELPNGQIQNIPWYLYIYRMAGYGNPSMTLMHSSTNNTKSKTVSISNWPSGIYLVRIDSNGSTYTKKFLKH